MNCEQSRNYLDPLIDNELSIDLTSEVMRHLESCIHCQNLWTDMSRLHDTISGAISRIEIPAGLVQRIRGRVEKTIDRRSSGPTISRKIGLLSVAAAIILIVIAAFVLFVNPKEKVALVPNDLVADHRTAAAGSMPPPTPETELHRLQRSLSLEPVNVPGWKLIKVEACKIDKLPAIHLCYVNGKKEMLSCYQLKHGLFDASGLKKHSMNGKIYCCGQLDDVSIVYCPRDNSDRILVGAMSERELMMIAVKS